MNAEVERSNAVASALEKRAKYSERSVGEMKAKLDGVVNELDASQKEARKIAAEVVAFKSHYSEAQDTISVVRSENKSLGEEVRELVDQLNAGARASAESEKSRKRVEAEKDALQGALESSESALENTEAKVCLLYC